MKSLARFISSLSLLACISYGLAAADTSYEEMKAVHDALLKGQTPKTWVSKLRLAKTTSERYWTLSQNYDELVKAPILEPAVLTSLGLSKPGPDGQTLRVTAGLMHTYGYMVAQLQTAYGLKGKRWIEGRLDERMGLPARLFLPVATDGEFLTNVTSALYNLIPSADPSGAARAALRQHSSAQIARRDFQGLEVAGRIEEAVTIETSGRKPVLRTVVVRTHFIPLLNLADMKTSDTHLLVYEVKEPSERWSRWVTLFPVAKSFVDQTLSSPQGPVADFKPRFNWILKPDERIKSAERKVSTLGALKASQ